MDGGAFRRIDQAKRTPSKHADDFARAGSQTTRWGFSVAGRSLNGLSRVTSEPHGTTLGLREKPRFKSIYNGSFWTGRAGLARKKYKGPIML